MVACVQTFGNFANFHPHLHILVTDGGFAPHGTFYVLPKVSLSGLEQLFRHRVLKMMLRAGLVTPQRVKLLLSWKHSGFNVDGSVRVIKKIYEVDPLLCPECSGPMRIIAFIEEQEVIRKILKHLKLWEESEPRPPPAVPEQVGVQYIPFFNT